MTVLGKYIFRVPADVAALVCKLHPIIKANVRQALKFISQDPYCGKMLKDELAELRSYRVKKFQIIYRIVDQENIIEIIAIGPRKNIYEETFQIISKEMAQKRC
jgi:mRNA interferase RelE/StbE